MQDVGRAGVHPAERRLQGSSCVPRLRRLERRSPRPVSDICGWASHLKDIGEVVTDPLDKTGTTRTQQRSCSDELLSDLGKTKKIQKKKQIVQRSLSQLNSRSEEHEKVRNSPTEGPTLWVFHNFLCFLFNFLLLPGFLWSVHVLLLNFFFLWHCLDCL